MNDIMDIMEKIYELSKEWCEMDGDLSDAMRAREIEDTIQEMVLDTIKF